MHKYIILILLFFVSSCASQCGFCQKLHQPSLRVAGWVSVQPDLSSNPQKHKHDKYAETYDEFVGALMDAGMKLAQSHWYKPTYGNQNLLYIKQRGIGDAKAKSWLNSKKDFPSQFYTFYHNALSVNKHRWHYTGYVDTTNGKGSRAFKAFVFVCGTRQSGVSVFYWGDGTAILPYKNDSLVELLKQLGPTC